MNKFALKTFPRANNLGDEIQELASKTIFTKSRLFC